MTTRHRRGAVAACTSVLAAIAFAALPSVLSPASAAPANLLSANQASVEVDLSGIEHGYRAENLSRTTAVAADGLASVSLVSTRKTGMAVRTSPQPAVAGAAYSASAAVRTSGVARQALVQLRFWTASGSALGAWNGPWVTATSAAWTRAVRANVVAPVGAATVSVYVVVQAPAAGVTAYADQLGLWQSSTAPAWAAPGSTETAAATTSAPTSVTTSSAPVPTTTAPEPVPTTSSAAPVPTTTTPTLPAPTTPAPSTTQTPAPVPGSNLLTSNQSDVETSTLGFEPAYGGMTLSRTSSSAQTGSSSLLVTATATASIAARTARSWTAVTPGLPYSAALSVRTGPEVTAGHRVLAQLRGYDAAGTQVSVANGPWTIVSSSDWTRVVASSTPPATAARISVHLVVESAVAGDTYLADTWGLWQATSAPPWSAPAAGSATVALFLGDSYSAGAGATTTSRRWTTLLAQQRGWLEANFARGGTGYLKTATTNGCGLVYCPTFREMAADAVAARPDIVVVAGGRNDLLLVSTDPLALQQAVSDTFAVLRQGLPTARIYAVTPMWDASTPPAVLQALRTWVVEAAAAHGVVLIDGADTWLLGHPEWITADHVHPNDDGYAVLAQQVALRLP